MKYLILPSILLFSFTFTYSQTLIPFLKSNGKFSYVDSSSLKPSFSQEYDEAGLFNNGLAAIKTNNKWGFINKTGKTIVPSIYDGTYGMNDAGVAVVWQNKKQGIINRNGEVVLPLEFETIYLSPPSVIVKLDGAYGLYNVDSRKNILPLEYDFIYQTSEGFNAVKKEDLYGFVDTKGKTLVPPTYENARSFTEGKAAVKIKDQWGFVDKSGNMIISPKYDDARSFKNGLAAVQLNKKWGFIDAAGKQVIACKYDKAFDFEEDITNVSMVTDYMWILIDKTGKEIKSLTGISKMRGFKNGLAYGETINEIVFVNKTGEEVFSKGLKTCKGIYDYENERAIMTINNNAEILIDKTGKEIGARQLQIKPFQKGVYKIKLKDKDCFMNLSGKIYAD